ncbi:MAG: ABC transporter permease, partial [Proteobacteria bacterium]|nr:ABC transporter permease [Pseudomonadota bacterium]
MIALALKLLWRDWRAGELTLLLASLVIAVGTVTTVTLFVDRLQQALISESASFLAADRVISSRDPIDPSILQRADELGLQRAESLSFLSMVFSAERAQLTSVKAVNGTYPLRGTLIAGDEPFVRGAPVDQGPAPGEVWMESRLFPSLDIQPGDLLDVGAASFPVTRVLIKEPDRGGGFENAGARLLMNLADVAATEVVQPGSRITYRYLFAGDPADLETFTAWAKPRIDSDSRIFGVKEGTESIGNALDRGERFLLLGSLLGVVLAGVAIALAAQRYSLRHYDHVAIMKTLGATPARVDGIFLFIFVFLGIAATLLGAGIGFGLQMVVANILAPYIPIELPAPSLRPVLLGLVTGFICLLSFALPPLLKLRSIEPVRVIRRDLGDPRLVDRLTYAFAVLGTLGLMWWYSQDLKLTLLIFSGAVVSLVILFFAAFLLLRSGRVLGMQAGSAWRLALAGMQRRGQENTLQILVFGLAIMLLLILFLVRTALISEWQAQIPKDAPNHFAINISPQDVAPIREMFDAEGVTSQPLYPMIRGSVLKVNGELATERDERLRHMDDDGPRSSSTRNLTWSDQLPDDNQLIAGQWWDADYAGPPLVSLEKDLAFRNQLKVGDELVFSIQGRELGTRVASIRTVAWDNMQPNFYIIFSPGALESFPSTFMTSFFLRQDQKVFLNELLREHPTMTVIEIDALIEQVQRIIDQVTLAIELVLVLILGSGALVLLASIQASMDERMKQHAILRTLGAGRRLVLGSLAIEFCALGLFAGILATIGAEITVFLLETQVFDLQYTVNPQLWILGPAVGTVLIGVVGILATRK